MVANLLLVLVLTFYAFNAASYASFQNIAYRAGYMSMTQLPLIFLLAGKNNIIGRLTGTSYERLNWIHRWCSRFLLITVTLHMGYWWANWRPYGYISVMSTTDPITIRGTAAWAILVWIVFSSFAPIRGWSYEFFVFQHTLSFVAFMVMVFLHTPSSDHPWLWGPVAFYFFDRVTRFARSTYTNLAIFHPQQRKAGTYSGMWACKATLTPLADDITRVSILNPPMAWKAGQHAFFSAHSIAPMQAHPFTISSIPEDNKVEFLVRAHKGGSRQLFDWAKKNTGLPSIQDATGTATVAVALEGPYGHLRPLRQFDSVALFGAGIGATFTMPLLRDLVRRWKDEPSSSQGSFINNLRVPDGIVTRRIRFVWVVKSRSQIQWFADQLWQVMEDVDTLHRFGRDVELDMSVYVTCDAEFTQDWDSSLLSPAGHVGKEEQGAVFALDNSSDSTLDEKKKQIQEQDIRTREIDPRSNISSGSSTAPGCQPDGTCCCQTTIADEDDADAEISEQAVCHCNCSHNRSTSLQTAITDKEPPRPLLHPSITLLAGRPHPRNIVRKTLEQAQGESAVVVCGPKALNHDVRKAVVSLSDERAVHKGTGAQGVWFHGECYGY